MRCRFRRPRRGRACPLRCRPRRRAAAPGAAGTSRPSTGSRQTPTSCGGVPSARYRRCSMSRRDPFLGLQADRNERTEACPLDICLYRYIMRGVARAATTADAFNAVAEPRRRQILDALADGERPVNDLVSALGMAQPQVSKHLRVLREVGAVEVREDGRRRLYRLNGHALKPIHDWVKAYERSWSERFEQLDAVLEELKEKEQGDGSDE